MKSDSLGVSTIRSGESGQTMKLGDDIDVWGWVLEAVKRWKTIAVFATVACGLSVAVSLLIPNTFTASSRVIPPQDSRSALGGALGGLADLASLSGLNGGSQTDLFVGMLKSQSVADAIIDRFDLIRYYEQDYRVKTYEKLEDHVTITPGDKDGIITIEVEDHDPNRAAAMANAYVEELKKLNVRLNLSSSGRERSFIEKRVAMAKDDLKKAEESLKAFQEGNKAIRLDEQAAALIEAIAKMRGELAAQEVQLGIARSTETEQSSTVKALRESVVQLRAQIAKLEKSPAAQKSSVRDIFFSTSEVPNLGLSFARLLREVKTQETIVGLLSQQFEIAKLNEARNTSTIETMDVARPPDRKSKPKRSVIVAASTAGGLVLGVLFALLQNWAASLSREALEGLPGGRLLVPRKPGEAA